MPEPYTLYKWNSKWRHDRDESIVTGTREECLAALPDAMSALGGGFKPVPGFSDRWENTVWALYIDNEGGASG